MRTSTKSTKDLPGRVVGHGGGTPVPANSDPSVTAPMKKGSGRVYVGGAFMRDMNCAPAPVPLLWHQIGYRYRGEYIPGMRAQTGDRGGLNVPPSNGGNVSQRLLHCEP